MLIRVNDKYDYDWRGGQLHIGDVFLLSTWGSEWEAEVTHIYLFPEVPLFKGELRKIGGSYGLSYGKDENRASSYALVAG